MNMYSDEADGTGQGTEYSQEASDPYLTSPTTQEIEDAFNHQGVSKQPFDESSPQAGSIRNIFPPAINSSGGRIPIKIEIKSGRTVRMFVDQESGTGVGAQLQAAQQPVRRTLSFAGG